MHYYQHHIGDFMKDTTNLDDHQLATYMRMIWAYYLAEKPVTGELEDIAFAMRSDEKTVRLLLRHYFTETPEGWRHKRCDAEIEVYKGKAEKASQSAKKRWREAKTEPTQCDGNANASADDAFACKSDANQEPITNNQEEPIKPSARGARFDPSTLVSEIPEVREAWSTWVPYRRSLRKGLQEDSWRKQLEWLEACHAEGHDVREIVLGSTRQGYTGLFKPKVSRPKESASQAWVNALKGDADAIEGTATRVH